MPLVVFALREHTIILWVVKGKVRRSRFTGILPIKGAPAYCSEYVIRCMQTFVQQQLTRPVLMRRLPCPVALKIEFGSKSKASPPPESHIQERNENW
jgi:hypothetical protein